MLTACQLSPVSSAVLSFTLSPSLNFGRPRSLPFARARSRPAFVRWLIFSRSSFASEDRVARRMLRTSSFSVDRCSSENDRNATPCEARRCRCPTVAAIPSRLKRSSDHTSKRSNSRRAASANIAASCFPEGASAEPCQPWRHPAGWYVDQVTGRGIELFDHVRDIGAEEAPPFVAGVAWPPPHHRRRGDHGLMRSCASSPQPKMLMGTEG